MTAAITNTIKVNSLNRDKDYIPYYRLIFQSEYQFWKDEIPPKTILFICFSSCPYCPQFPYSLFFWLWTHRTDQNNKGTRQSDNKTDKCYYSDILTASLFNERKIICWKTLHCFARLYFNSLHNVDNSACIAALDATIRFIKRIQAEYAGSLSLFSI